MTRNRLLGRRKTFGKSTCGHSGTDPSSRRHPADCSGACEARARAPLFAGKNLFVNELTQNRGIPVEATLGGPETKYPEFRKKLKDAYAIPPPCKTGCGGPPIRRRRDGHNLYSRSSADLQGCHR
jgi:hypothetical protein